MLDHFRLFARYNKWANDRIYAAADLVDDAARQEDRGAFFGSLHGTLNHILVADRVWMDRLEQKPDEFMKSYRLDTVTEPEWAGLCRARGAMDARILNYIDDLDEARLNTKLTFRDSTGVTFTRAPIEVLAHFFNHQTHHRGQAHDLVHQITGAAPSLDLYVFQKEREKAG